MAQEPWPVHLVHSDSEVLLTLCDVLSAAGFQVSASSDAIDALVYIARSKPKAILCRWEMPEIEGPAFIGMVRKVSPDSRVILCSRRADGPMYEETLHLGGADVIQEPLSSLAVLQAVMRLTGLGVPYERTEEIPSFDLDAHPSRGNGQAER